MGREFIFFFTKHCHFTLFTPMDKAAKAEATIKRVCDSLGITADGRKWLDVALDPFKDITQKPNGYPDRVMAPSVVQTIHDSLSLAAPAGTVANWDANIFLDNAWVRTNLYNTQKLTTAFLQSGQAIAPYQRGGLVVRGAAAGTPLGMTTTYSGLPYVTDVFDNDTSCRVIGMGMEIHNTTADLYKQGSLITYMVSDEPVEYPVTAIIDTATVKNNLTYMGLELVEPPRTASQAIDLPGSLQWEAAKGCYIVPRFNEEGNDPVDLREKPIFSVENSSGISYCPKIDVTGNTMIFNALGLQNASLPITLSGAYLSGLSKETTLTVNLTYYVEQLPSIDSALRRVSSPPPCEDIKAIELYTRIVANMPTGVEVNDNFLGAFVAGIARVASMVAPYVPRIINAISGASEAVRVVSDVVNRDRQITHSNQSDRSQANNDRQLVVRQPEPRSQAPVVTVTHPSKGKELIVISEASRRDTNRREERLGRRSPQAQTVRNQRRKDYSRLAKYIKASEAGNRWVD